MAIRRPYTVRNPFRRYNRQVGPACHIWWDSHLEGYQMQVQYNEQFKKVLKELIHKDHRSFDDKTKFWAFAEEYFDAVTTLAKQVWPNDSDLLIESRETVEARERAVPQQIVAASLDNDCADFLKLVGIPVPEKVKEFVEQNFNDCRKAYRLAAIRFHPDKGGDPSQMAELNALWSRITKLLQPEKKEVT